MTVVLAAKEDTERIGPDNRKNIHSEFPVAHYNVFVMADDRFRDEQQLPQNIAFPVKRTTPNRSLPPIEEVDAKVKEFAKAAHKDLDIFGMHGLSRTSIVREWRYVKKHFAVFGPAFLHRLEKAYRFHNLRPLPWKGQEQTVSSHNSLDVQLPESRSIEEMKRLSTNELSLIIEVGSGVSAEQAAIAAKALDDFYKACGGDGFTVGVTGSKEEER